VGQVDPDDRRGRGGPETFVTVARLVITVAGMVIGGLLAWRGDGAGLALVGACVGYWLGSPADRRLH
jgi:hypothetical protein